jgi:hypothetical protein
MVALLDLGIEWYTILHYLIPYVNSHLSNLLLFISLYDSFKL